MSNGRPVCGTQPGPLVGSEKTDLVKLFGAISGVISAIIGLVGLANKMIAAPTFTFWGMGAVGIAGVAGAIAAWVAVGYMYFNRCWSREAAVRCWAGAVNAIKDSFDSGWDVVFPSGAMHPRVDVVIKPEYWPLAVQGAGFLECSPPPPSIGSPIIQTFYKSEAVCAAGLGATIGAGVGVAAAVAIAIAIGAIGCATVILCLLALLIAAIVGAAIALAGAAIGGNIGQAVAGDDDPTDDDGAEISEGDLVSVNGKLLTMEQFESANVGWWAQSTTIHGPVSGIAPYSDSDAAQLQDDICQRDSGGTQTPIR